MTDTHDAIFSLTTDGLETVTRERDEAREQLAEARAENERLADEMSTAEAEAVQLQDIAAENEQLRNQLSAARRGLERIADGDPGHVTIATDALRASGAAQTCPGGC